MSSGATIYSCAIEKLKRMYTLVWQNMCKNGIIDTKGELIMTVQEFYIEVGGNLEDLLDRIPDEDLIISFLDMYLKSPEFNNMIQAYNERDYKMLFESSHALKGMAANMSLDRNFETIASICEAVRHGEPNVDISDLIKKATSEHHKLEELFAKL